MSQLLLAFCCGERISFGRHLGKRLCTHWHHTQTAFGADRDQCHPSINQATLGRAIGFDKATTSQLLRGLEAQAMFTRENAVNRRSVSLNLTTAGIALLDKKSDTGDSFAQGLRIYRAGERDRVRA
jgi:hypothetical protein